jgi:hypothetical protein
MLSRQLLRALPSTIRSSKMSSVTDTIASVLPEPIAKRMKSTRVIGTHSGSFHADEALGVAMLRMTDEYRDADLVRTRDQAKREFRE